MIYLDNAATSWPKPLQVSRAMDAFLTDVGGSPGRSSHRLAIEAGRIVYHARELLAELFAVNDPLRILLGPNATYFLNLALHGLLRPGDHVITSSMEHNAVMRPLRYLERCGVDLTVLRCSKQGELNPLEVTRSIRPQTTMIVLNHSSNVTGGILSIAQMGQIARKHNLIFLVDAAQTAGVWPIDIEKESIDLLVFTGHKGLYGPPGTGGMVVGSRVKFETMTPLIFGGTGSRSSEEEQPDFLPDRYESGTPNTVGLAGLAAGIEYLFDKGIENIQHQNAQLTAKLHGGLAEIPRVVVYGKPDFTSRTAIVSFNINGLAPSEVGLRLDEDYNIMCRVGLHCAPAAHKTIGTFPIGTVRFSLGLYTTDHDIEQAIMAVTEIARSVK
ncbi:aminotransferase class V-fold PLP-dependent enzyme [Candidatus Bipolaricaulota bacterium]|nr:aminotransferase class V-fold PLP-dependent enzyme [Candidatus Bipolaricaulota bacterium]